MVSVKRSLGAGSIAVALALTAACQKAGPNAAYDNYLGRLERTLEVNAPQPLDTPLPRLPRVGKLGHDIPPGNLDALDFLAISGCAVQITIGKRNSSLGRMATPSQRLLLELEYLQLAPECIDYQRQQGNQQLAQDLQTAWLQKKQQLPARVFNATLAGGEYRAFWRAGATDSNYPADTGSQVISALEAINADVRRWLSGDYSADNTAFELRLADVATGDGGALLRALSEQAGWLDAADATVNLRLARGPLCGPSRRPPAADILTNVIRKYFIGDIQPRAAALGSRYHQLLPPIEDLEQLLSNSLSPPYMQWLEQRNSALVKLQAAPREHVQLLQKLQAPCQTDALG